MLNGDNTSNDEIFLQLITNFGCGRFQGMYCIYDLKLTVFNI